MANPSIIYNPSGTPIEIVFPEELSDWTEPDDAERSTLVSEGGVVASYFQHSFGKLMVDITRMPRNAAFEDAIHAAWGWLKRGGEFAFAFDSADKVSSTVRVATAVNATVIPVVSSSSFVNGQPYLIESIYGGYATQRFVVSNKDVSLSPSLTADRNMIYPYVVGDVVRSRRYFPECVTLQTKSPIRENPGDTITFHLEAITTQAVQVV